MQIVALLNLMVIMMFMDVFRRTMPSFAELKGLKLRTFTESLPAHGYSNPTPQKQSKPKPTEKYVSWRSGVLNANIMQRVFIAINGKYDDPDSDFVQTKLDNDGDIVAELEVDFDRVGLESFILVNNNTGDQSQWSTSIDDDVEGIVYPIKIDFKQECPAEHLDNHICANCELSQNLQCDKSHMEDHQCQACDLDHVKDHTCLPCDHPHFELNFQLSTAYTSDVKSYVGKYWIRPDHMVMRYKLSIRDWVPSSFGLQPQLNVGKIYVLQ